jgi:flagellar motor switch protein FliG
MSKAELRKAAVLLLSLSEAQAARLSERLDPREAETVAAEMRRVKSITADEQALVLADLIEAKAAHAGRAQARQGDAEGWLHPRRPIVSPPRSAEPRPFAFLRDVDCRTFLELATDERPQTIALVVSRVPRAYGAELIAGLDERRRAAVVRALAFMEPVDPGVVADVAHAIQERLCARA